VSVRTVVVTAALCAVTVSVAVLLVALRREYTADAA
jgi:hypothetical protein